METKCYKQLCVLSLQLAVVKTKTAVSDSIQKKIASKAIAKEKDVSKDTDKSADTQTTVDNSKQTIVAIFFTEKKDYKNFLLSMT